MRRATGLYAMLLAGLTCPAIAQRAQAPSLVTVQGTAAPAQVAPVRPAVLKVSAAAAPRTIQVFVVPVPSELLSSRPVTYVVTPAGGATIIPPFSGVVAPGDADP